MVQRPQSQISMASESNAPESTEKPAKKKKKVNSDDEIVLDKLNLLENEKMAEVEITSKPHKPSEDTEKRDAAKSTSNFIIWFTLLVVF